MNHFTQNCIVRRPFHIFVLASIALLLIATAARSAPIETFLDTTSGTYSEGAGGWGAASPGAYWLIKPGRIAFANGGTATAQWTPGVTGTYTVQVEYAVHPTEATNATWSVNGSPVATVNETEWADQSNPAGNIHPTAPAASGYYTLGTYTLTPASVISVTNPTNGSGGTGTLDTNLIRLTAAKDAIVNDQSGAVSNGNWFFEAYPLNASSAEPNGQTAGFAILTPNHNTSNMTYSLGSTGITGNSDVYISWAVGTTLLNHTTDARYVLDLDGNFATTGDEFTVNIDENKFADQTTFSSSSSADIWSGWYDMGNYAITSSSKVRVFNADGLTTTYTTADALRVVQLLPEPASMALLAAGGLLLTRRRR